MMPSWGKLVASAGRAIEGVRMRLPAELRDETASLAVLFERKPAREDLDAGIEPDTLGVFEGSSLREPAGLFPPRIRLWLENLWDLADNDEQVFCDEVATTYLHEAGHYLGLNEQEIAARGLE